MALCACGRKGPPLPPLVKVPAAPADVKAVRRGNTVDIQFTVPSTNRDGTRPANVERVDVYGFAGPDIKDEELIKLARLKVAAVAVKAPRDPDDTVEPDESTAELDPLEGAGLDQGAVARVQLVLTAGSLMSPEIAKKAAQKPTVVADRPGPLVGPPTAVPSLTLVAVGVSGKGHAGALSARLHVPFVAPPPPPLWPWIAYSETAMTVAWFPPAELAAGDGLPAKPIWFPQPTIGYHVYEVPPAGAPAPVAAPSSNGAPSTASASPPDERLTESPVADTAYADTRLSWGRERCYVVRTVETFAGQSIESDPSSPACETAVDTFPPAAPRGLTVVPSERTIHLIWQANGEKDLAGYIVLRGSSADTVVPLMQTPIAETTFSDGVPSGAHYVYVVKAVDKAGNASAASTPEEATARE